MLPAMARASVPAPTRRLRFRPFTREDRPLVLRTFEDPAARRFYPDAGTEGWADRWVDRQIKRYAEEGHGLWVVERIEDGECVGDCGLTWQRLGEERVLEVGYHLIAAHRGRGHATEAARACVDHAFRVLGAESVTSLVDLENLASQAVAARVHAGRRPEPVLHAGFPHQVYETRRSEWRATPR